MPAQWCAWFGAREAASWGALHRGGCNYQGSCADDASTDFCGDSVTWLLVV